MNLFKTIGKGAVNAIKLATPVVLTSIAPEALINVAGGAVLKHGVKSFNNQNIPVANMAVSTAVSYLQHAITTGDWVGGIIPAVQHGGFITGMSWGIHQSAKVPAAQWITDPVLAAKVGPGEKFSL